MRQQIFTYQSDGLFIRTDDSAALAIGASVLAQEFGWRVAIAVAMTNGTMMTGPTILPVGHIDNSSLQQLHEMLTITVTLFSLIRATRDQRATPLRCILLPVPESQPRTSRASGAGQPDDDGRYFA